MDAYGLKVGNIPAPPETQYLPTSAGAREPPEVVDVAVAVVDGNQHGHGHGHGDGDDHDHQRTLRLDLRLQLGKACFLEVS